MTAFHQFTQMPSGKPIWINPTLVRLIRPRPSGKGAEIVFDDEQVVVVDGTPEEVIRRIA